MLDEDTRLPRGLPSSAKSCHQRRLSEVYGSAVEIGGGSLILLGGRLMAFGICGAIPVYIWGLWDLRHQWAGDIWSYVGVAITLLTGGAVFLIGAWLELFSPSESPLILDRRSRKIYYVHRSNRRKFIFFGPSKIEVRIADWDRVEGEIRSSASATPSSVSRITHLALVVGSSPDDATEIDSYVIHSLEFPTMMWEYIRRYMELDAPPLALGEKPPTQVATRGKGLTLVDALKPWVASYREDWRERPVRQFVEHLMLPYLFIYLFTNRLVVWTAQEVRWPQEVIDALGAPITEADLAADTRRRLRAAEDTPNAPILLWKPDPEEEVTA